MRAASLFDASPSCVEQAANPSVSESKVRTPGSLSQRLGSSKLGGMGGLNLYLIRHEDAGDAERDEHRSLTELGRRRMRKTARFCLEQGVVVDAIFTSPLVRAVQTAEILAEGLGFDGPIEAHAEIAFPSRIETLTRLIDTAPGSWRGLALVGHEPTLGLLAHHLLGAEAGLRGMRKGAVLALEYANSRTEFRFLVLGDGPTRHDDPTEL